MCKPVVRFIVIVYPHFARKGSYTTVHVTVVNFETADLVVGTIRISCSRDGPSQSLPQFQELVIGLESSKRETAHST